MSIVLSASVRQNLLSLQSTADLLSTTQNRLATGKKVNTALDNPTNFFTAASLDNRSAVDWSESRFWRTEEERTMDMFQTFLV